MELSSQNETLDTTINHLMVEISEIIEFLFLLLDSSDLSLFSFSKKRLKNNKNNFFFYQSWIEKILKNWLYIYIYIYIYIFVKFKDKNKYFIWSSKP